MPPKKSTKKRSKPSDESLEESKIPDKLEKSNSLASEKSF